ncbi:MAG: 23S rRNA (adenine(2503)-C(2))-methyltransferase RlmN [Elusimicrobiota bacterium]|jgi:23S rRNA (adenine2503-C2)-methyltransferase|nr:23S rRNA (adenine(2503)-C(2))-methyltransferase RlmN [Elusimicrobiota bacterium]
MKKHILDLSLLELQNSLKGIISKDYEYGQIVDWLYAKKEPSFDKWNNLSKTLRSLLPEYFLPRVLSIHKKEISKKDKTIRYTFKTLDKKLFYAVFLPSKYKNSICLSSQIGCPVGCSFCQSGKSAFIRNLTSGEILEQILQIENDTKEKISGILFMGMGEALFNCINLERALKTILSKSGLYIGKRNITVSTAGDVAGIKKLALSGLNVNLAVSLHASDDDIRKRIMPNIRFSLDDILNASLSYINKTNSRLTVEYILIKDINDSPAQCHKLARLLKRKGFAPHQILLNLIPFNRIDKSKFAAPDEQSAIRFQKVLKLNGLQAMIRQPRGQDIRAACGQLGF